MNLSYVRSALHLLHPVHLLRVPKVKPGFPWFSAVLSRALGSSATCARLFTLLFPTANCVWSLLRWKPGWPERIVVGHHSDGLVAPLVAACADSCEAGRVVLTGPSRRFRPSCGVVHAAQEARHRPPATSSRSKEDDRNGNATHINDSIVANRLRAHRRQKKPRSPQEPARCCARRLDATPIPPPHEKWSSLSASFSADAASLPSSAANCWKCVGRCASW